MPTDNTMTLDEKVREYKDLLDRKDDLAEQTKKNNEALKQAEQEVAQMMVDEEKPNTTVDGFTYSLQQKTNYSKKSEVDLEQLRQDEGIIFFEALREQGLGSLIQEKVNAQSLQAAMRGLAESDEGIPDDLLACLNIYDTLGVQKRKANTKALDRAKKSKEGK